MIAMMSFSGLAGPSFAQDMELSELEAIKEKTEAQKKLEAELKAKRDKVVSEIGKLRTELTSMSININVLEDEQTLLRDQLIDLEAQETEISSKVLTDKSSLQKLLAALQRIENNPPPALASSPADAARAVRAGILMTSLSDQLNDRVDVLRGSLEELTIIKANISTKQEQLETNRTKLSSQKNKIQGRVSEKNTLERSLRKDYDAAQKRRRELAAEAQTLQELFDRLEAQSKNIIPRIKPDPNAPETAAPPSRTPRSADPFSFESGALRFSKSKGKLYAPVNGTLSKRYSSGHPGVSIRVKGSAQVSAPAAGRVEFAGPFKNYDKVVILNVGDGYFLLLTGMGQLYVQDNAEISAGEPLGEMSGNTSSNEKLYIEVRKNGSTIDPVPWFGTTFAKPSNR